MTFIGLIVLFGASLFLSLIPFSMLSSLTSAVVVGCVHNQPDILLSHQESLSTAATSSYLLTVTNIDTSLCTPSVFDLQSISSSDLVGVFTTDPILLQPGESLSVPYLLHFSSSTQPVSSVTLLVQPLERPTLGKSIIFEASLA